MDIKSFNDRQRHEIDLLELVIDHLQSSPICDVNIHDVIEMRDRLAIEYENYRQLLLVK